MYILAIHKQLPVADSPMLYTLQLVRFIAAAFVLLFHLELYRSGYKGVDVFFVISGFVMYYTTCYKTRPPARVFVINRLTKIFILYWVVLLLLFIVKPATIKALDLRNLFLLPGHYSLIGVSWSLSYELYFYLLFGCMVYLLPPTWRKWFFVLLYSISTGVTVFTVFSNRLQGSVGSFLLGANSWECLSGVIVGYLFCKYRSAFNKRLLMVGTLLISGLFAAIQLQYHDPANHLIYGVLSFGLILLVTSLEWQAPVNKTMGKLFKQTGDASYALYLLGPIVAVTIPDTSMLLKGVIMVVAVSASIVLHICVELPLLKAVRSWLRVRAKKMPPGGEAH